MDDDWNRSTQSKSQIEAKLLNKQEAAIRRERARAYAYSHQVPQFRLFFSSSRCLLSLFLTLYHSVCIGLNFLEDSLPGELKDHIICTASITPSCNRFSSMMTAVASSM